MGATHTRAYCGGELVLADFLAEPDTIVWVDCGEADKPVLVGLAGELGLHSLAVEDALSAHQRPKLDHYATHLFLSTHAVRLDAESGQLLTTEIDAFINHRWLSTVRKGDDFDLGGVLQRVDRSSDLLTHGVSVLVYALLDVVVDGYFEAISGFDEYYDLVADDIFAEKPMEPSRQRHWFDMRRSIVRFHRLVFPLREAISSLMRREHSVISEEMYPYFQDVYDHILRVSESTDSLRELATTIVETNLSLRDYRQNLVMKKLTAWAAIVAVPTLITGFYGMNVPFPGSGRPGGFAAAAGLIVAGTVGLYAQFRRSGWL